MKTVTCDLCGSGGGETLWRAGDLLMGVGGRDYNIFKCSGCGLIYLNPRPEPIELEAHYGGDYNSHLTPEGRLAGALRDALMARHAARMMRLAPPRPRVMEVGCGDGTYLRHLAARGAECAGIEMRAEAAARAREKFGLDVICAALEAASPGEGCFDLVIMRHVIEHVASPTETLEKVRAWLKPGGRLVMMLPDSGHSLVRLFGDAWCGFDVPRHLYSFSRATMKKLLEKTGYRAESISGAFLPNDWVYSIRLWAVKKNMPRGVVGFFGMSNLPVMGLFAPVSFIQGLMGDSGRMQVIAAREG